MAFAAAVVAGELAATAGETPDGVFWEEADDRGGVAFSEGGEEVPDGGYVGVFRGHGAMIPHLRGWCSAPSCGGHAFLRQAPSYGGQAG